MPDSIDESDIESSPPGSPEAGASSECGSASSDTIPTKEELARYGGVMKECWRQNGLAAAQFEYCSIVPAPMFVDPDQLPSQPSYTAVQIVPSQSSPAHSPTIAQGPVTEEQQQKNSASEAHLRGGGTPTPKTTSHNAPSSSSGATTFRAAADYILRKKCRKCGKNMVHGSSDLKPVWQSWAGSSKSSVNSAVCLDALFVRLLESQTM
jgi:hypothetical protein